MLVEQLLLLLLLWLFGVDAAALKACTCWRRKMPEYVVVSQISEEDERQLMCMINGGSSRAEKYPIAHCLLRRMYDGRWSATRCQHTN